MKNDGRVLDLLQQGLVQGCFSTRGWTGGHADAAGSSVSHHERHKAAVPAACPLLLITRPHDLHTADGTKATKLTRQVGLINLQHNTCQVLWSAGGHTSGYGKATYTAGQRYHKSNTGQMPS